MKLIKNALMSIAMLGIAYLLYRSLVTTSEKEQVNILFAISVVNVGFFLVWALRRQWLKKHKSGL